MNISIGILAWNEEISIRTTIHSIFSQSLITGLPESGHSVEIICVPNGCSDNTAQSARGALLADAQKVDAGPALSWRVCELKEPGKTNAWNRFVHELSRPDTDIFFLADADIQIYMPDTLSNMLEELVTHPDAFVATDLPVKHVAFKEKVGLLDRLSLQTSGMRSDTGQLCGQLYCARSSFLRRFRIPEQIIVEDGFIKKMAVSNLLTEPEDPARRIVVAETASHVFQAYTRLPDVYGTLRRQIAGYIIHRWIWEHVKSRMQAGEDAGQTMVRLYQADPQWSADLIRDQIENQGWKEIHQVVMETHLKNFRKTSGGRKALALPVLWLRMLMDTIVFRSAVRRLKKGQMVRVWRDTRTTDGEVAR